MKSRKREERNYGVLRHEMAFMAKASEEQQRKIINNLTVEHALKWDADFEHWAHENQLPPSGEGWRTWLMMAGRGFGKTRAGAEWIFRLGEGRPGSLIALAGATIADAASAGFNELQLAATEVVRLGASPVRLVAGVLANECRDLFVDWRRTPGARAY